ncbi:uncharacterized protein LOC143555164 [Bidens hawaiensis]|uniref:uncharacterized protein LOC143555164 n=1 Tax=Bidens hawaiensis TaxID=980011 RepID=UPI00404A8256
MMVEVLPEDDGDDGGDVLAKRHRNTFFAFFVSILCRNKSESELKKKNPHHNGSIKMSALFNFHSFLTVVLLVICTCTFLKMQFPTILEQKTGFRGFFWKAARIGERLSPWVAVGCFTMGVSIIFF